MPVAAKIEPLLAIIGPKMEAESFAGTWMVSKYTTTAKQKASANARFGVLMWALAAASKMAGVATGALPQSPNDVGAKPQAAKLKLMAWFSFFAPGAFKGTYTYPMLQSVTQRYFVHKDEDFVLPEGLELE